MTEAPAVSTNAPRPAAAWAVVLYTAAAYGLVGAAALQLAGPSGYASPLYPSAGIALAAVLCYGRTALLGVLLGAFAVNTGLGLQRGASGLSSLLLPLLIALGAALQAGVGAALVRRFVSQPLVLNRPGDILRFAVLGALLACSLSASVGVTALWGTGVLPANELLSNGLTWWLGDALGVLITAPLVLTLIGQPQADWRGRRRTLGIPMLLALALLAAGLTELSRLDRQRVQATFERDVDRLTAVAATRLAVPLYALQALHGAARARPVFDAAALNDAAGWWLSQSSSPLLAMGYSEWVSVGGLPAFEAEARARGLPDYRVFDRDGGAARATDSAVLALRLIEPLQANRAALGVNALSIPAARAALLATRDSGQPAVTAGFRLTQASGDETGVVIYQALYRGDAAATETAASRAARFRGVVFVTVPTERALGDLAGAQTHLRWCLLDTDRQATRRRLAGLTGCEADADGSRALEARRELLLAGRPLQLRISAVEGSVPGRLREANWLLSVVGLAAAAMLGALLLTVTGHSRRTELAVTGATTELRREIDERKAAETALRDSEERLRSIVDHVPLGVLFMDPMGQLIDCNPQLASMLGHTVAALKDRSVTEFVQAGEVARLRDLRRALLDGADSSSIDTLRLQAANGRTLLARVDASALRGNDGRVLRIVVVVEDITEHLRLVQSERALQRAEAANLAKNEFLSRMSHELRTPLNAMIGFAQLLGLDREPQLAPHQAEWTQQIQRAGWHLLEMINETLDLARIESGSIQLQLGPLALQPLLTACSAMLSAPASQRGIRIDVKVNEDAGAVLADATRLKQVLTNLLSNAVKYNAAQGTVSVSARRLAGPSGDRVEITVTDTGLGMSAAQLAALFQPYNRLGRENSGIEGTGIGLVISRRLAELMQGTLEASSEVGRGSSFTLCLPAAAEAEVPGAVFSETSPAPYQRRLVHYVEDNETNIEVMRGVLAQRSQIEMKSSTLGLDGLAAIREQQPDLILLDMQLPDISGLELLRHLKHDDSVAHIPVVVVSADATSRSTEQALVLGAAHYVTKPVEVAQLLLIVDTLLENANSRWG